MHNKLLESVTSNRKFRISIFNDLEDHIPKSGYFTLKEISESLSISQEIDEKGSVPLFNGTYFSHKNRRIESAYLSDLLIFDFDGKNYNYSKEELSEIFKNYYFFAYETASSNHTFHEYRWRLVIPLSRSVTPDEYSFLYQYFLDKFNLDLDRQTRSINAIFYLPEHYEGFEPYFIENKANLLNPDLLLNKKEKKEIKKAINTDIRLTDKNSICGFSLDIEKKKSYSLEEIKNITTKPATGLMLAKLIGIDVEKCGISLKAGRMRSRALKSVIPWHDKDDNPSTGLMIKESGEDAGKLIYRSFKSEDSDNPIFDIHYIYACQKIGKRIPLDKWTKSISLIWLIRSLIDASVITKPKFKVIKEDFESNTTKFLFNSMTLLAECRSLLDIYTDDEIPFSFSFAELWMGISRQTASKHFKILEARNLIQRTCLNTERMKINGFILNFDKGFNITEDDKNINLIDSNLNQESKIIPIQERFNKNHEDIFKLRNYEYST